jgi:hypothetical protein
MSNGPAASNSLGLIGVELYRLHVGSVSATNFVFAAVQTDWRYLAWYSFFDDPVRTTTSDRAGGRKRTGQPTITEPVLGRANTNSVECFCIRRERSG